MLAPQGVPVGTVTMHAGSTAPAGWLLCDGGAVSRTTYAALYSVCSTTYGVGDGSSTFNVPDCSGIFVRGAGTSTKLTNANGTAFSGTRGTYQNDAMQGHIHTGVYATTNNTQSGSGNLGFTGGSANTSSPATDGSSGTPRTTTETRPANLSMFYIIKY